MQLLIDKYIHIMQDMIVQSFQYSNKTIGLYIDGKYTSISWTDDRQAIQ